MTGTVKLYSFTYSIGGSMYSGQIPAMSWAEAETLVPFALVDGELVEEISPNLCSLCIGAIKRDLTHPEAIQEAIQEAIWDDVIDG